MTGASLERRIAELLYDNLTGHNDTELMANAALAPFRPVNDDEAEWALDAPASAAVHAAYVGDRWGLAERLARLVVQLVEEAA